MPPPLALFLCTSFVLTLLWMDRRRTPTISLAVWLPTAWMLICASRTASSWFNTRALFEGEFNLEDGNPLDRLLLSLMIVSGIVILMRRHLDWRGVFRENRWLFVLFAYMLISIAWSEFAYVSFKRLIKTGGTIVMALVVLSEQSPSDAFKAILQRISLITVPFSLLLIKYYPVFGVQYGRWSGATSWAGVAMTKNMLGALCLVTTMHLTVFLVRLRERKEPNIGTYYTIACVIILLLSVYLLKGSFSATSTVVLILSLCVFFALRRRGFAARRLGLVLTASGSVIFLLFFVSNQLFETSPVAAFASYLGRDPTLTGRADMIWDVLLPLAKQSPFFGVGYGAFWITPVFEFPINQAHNGYLDVYVEIGATGLLLLAFVIVSYFIKARQDFDVCPDWASLRLVFLLAVLIHNTTETSFLRSTLLIWNIFVFFYIIPATSSSMRNKAVTGADSEYWTTGKAASICERSACLETTST